MTERREPTSAEIQAHVDDLERAAVTDRQSIADLQDVLAVDRDLIAHLEAGGLVDREKIANLETALVTARRIGAAMGIIMATMKVTEQQSFAMLRLASENTNRKLRDIAEDVIRTGALEP